VPKVTKVPRMPRVGSLLSNYLILKIQILYTPGTLYNVNSGGYLITLGTLGTLGTSHC